jgi:hypothetical protein
VVDAAAREREAAAHRREVHDLAPALLAHLGQHEPAHRQQAEDVGVELGADALVGYGLDRAGLAVARVVDQHADGALRRLDRLDGGAARRLVGHVERERLTALHLEVGERLDAPRRRVDGPALLGEVRGGGGADAGGAAGDQHRARVHRMRTVLPTGTRG